MNSLNDSKLIDLLKVFTRTEWRDLHDFISSGLAGSRGKALELYHLLANEYPHFDNHSLDKNLVFKGLFGNSRYEDKKLRYAITDLYRHATQFLKLKALEYQPEEGNHLLSTLLARRGAGKAYLSLYQADATNTTVDAESYYNRYRKSFVHLNHYLPGQQRKPGNPLSDTARNLDIFFVAKKMQLLCEVINVKNVMSVDYEFYLHDDIIRLLQNGTFSDVPVINIYYRIYMTLTHPDDETHFEALNELLGIHGERFGREELRDMYQYLMNYCIKKINQGVVKYVTVLFNIYNAIIQNRVIYSDSYISQWDFKNIVVIGIRAGEHEWVRRFIENHKGDLRLNEKENAYVYNLAYYYFSVGDYRKTLSLLSKVEFTDVYYQLDMRAILLKCYFETDDQEAFFYHVAAFRIFLSRNKLVSDYQRTTYRNLVKYATALVRAQGNEKKLLQLQQEIEEVKQIADINWLRRKIK